MHSITTAFDNGRGQRLAAMLDWPADDRPIAYAIFAHCFTCSKTYKAVRHISRALAAEGFGVLSFVSLDRADHLLGDSDDSRYAARMIATWAKRYLPRTREGVRLPGFEDNRVAKVPTED